MSSTCNSDRDSIFEIFGIQVWSKKGIQKVLNKIIQNIDELEYDTVIGAFKLLLTYPGIWDSGNVLKFIDVFHTVVKKYCYNRDNQIDLRDVWGRFEDLKVQQQMESVTISVEESIRLILEVTGQYTTTRNHESSGTRAYPIR